MIIATIQFIDNEEAKVISAQEVVHCHNGLEKFILDGGIEISIPVHRIKLITYCMNE